MNEIEKILLELVERYPALDSCRGEIMEAYHRSEEHTSELQSLSC